MTIINFKVDDKKKKKIEAIAKIKGYNSVSEFIRQIIDKEMDLQEKIDEFLAKNPPFDREKIKIPDYIPDGKYLGISRNSIVVIGDSAQEVAASLAEKFPESASGIIHKGHESETIDFIFSLFSIEDSKCYHQAEYKNNYYPILPFSVNFKENKMNFYGLIDTGATLTAINKKILEDYDIKPIRKSKVFTANGISEVNIFKKKFYHQKVSYDLEFMAINIAEEFSFHALLGKNFIDKFNILFLGKEKLFCLQPIFDL